MLDVHSKKPVAYIFMQITSEYQALQPREGVPWMILPKMSVDGKSSLICDNERYISRGHAIVTVIVPTAWNCQPRHSASSLRTLQGLALSNALQECWWTGNIYHSSRNTISKILSQHRKEYKKFLETSLVQEFNKIVCSMKPSCRSKHIKFPS